MSKILLIRHGQTESNVKQVYLGFSQEDLNPVGYAQVNQLSVQLHSVPIAAFYSSPLKRAYSTAEILAKPHGKKVIVADDLTEIDLGDWQGLSKSTVQHKWPTLWAQMLNNPEKIEIPNGETLAHVLARAERLLAEISARHPNDSVVLVTHEVVIKSMVILGLHASAEIYHNFRIDCASLSILKTENKKLSVITLNSMGKI